MKMGTQENTVLLICLCFCNPLQYFGKDSVALSCHKKELRQKSSLIKIVV